MRHPKHAIMSLQKMRTMKGKPIYFVIGPAWNRKAPAPWCVPGIIKLTVKGAYESRLGRSVGNREAFVDGFSVDVEEVVEAHKPNGIFIESDWSVQWYNPPEGNTYFFSNFWFAYAYLLQRNKLGETP